MTVFRGMTLCWSRRRSMA